MRNLQYIQGVATLKLDSERCTGCGNCLQVCPRQVLGFSTADQTATEKQKVQILVLDNCIECGACMINCPFSALSVEAGTGCAIAILNGKMKGTKPCC